MDFLTGLAAWPYVQMGLQILGSVVVLATVIIGLTPTKADDALLEGAKSKFSWFFNAIAPFSLIQKK